MALIPRRVASDGDRHRKATVADPQRRLEMIHLLASQGSVENFETRMLRKDGSLHWVSINARTVLDEQGNVLYHEGTMRDITDGRKQRKRWPRVKSDTGQPLNTPMTGCHLNQKWKVSVCEQEVRGNVRLRYPEEILGKPVTLVVHPTTRSG